MAERPKTAAQIAEESGKLNAELVDTITINEVRNSVEELRQDIYEINRRLSWITCSVKATFNAIDTSHIKIDEQTLQTAIIKLSEINEQALKIGDILSGDYDEN